MEYDNIENNYVGYRGKNGVIAIKNGLALLSFISFQIQLSYYTSLSLVINIYNY